MSPLIKLSLAINLISSSHTLRILVKYSTLLHTHLSWILNHLFHYLCYPFCKLLQGSHHQMQSIIGKDVDCAVCLCKMKEREEIRVLKCEHVFHRDCLDTWWVGFNRATCPLCRDSVMPFGSSFIQSGDDDEIPWLR